MSRRLAVLAVLSALWGPATVAQPAPGAPQADESRVVQDLLVVKRLPGPALWKATKGDAEVFILGAVTPIRHLQAWDSSRLENALDDAVVLLLPPKAHIGLFDAVGFKIGGGGLKLGGGRTLDQVLPPAVRARFDAKLAQIKADPKRYAGLKPAAAGVQLIGDFRRAAGLSDGKPSTTVVRLADKHGVPHRAVADYNLKGMMQTLGKLSDAANLACLSDAMDEMDFEASEAVPAGAAWAQGDLSGVRAHYRASRLERCLQQAPTLDALLETATADSTKALEEVLNRPGKTVAVVDLALLLRANGVLDRLKASGAEMSVPDR